MGMNILATSNEIQKESKINIQISIPQLPINTKLKEANTEENQYEDEDSTIPWARDVPQ